MRINKALRRVVSSKVEYHSRPIEPRDANRIKRPVAGTVACRIQQARKSQRQVTTWELKRGD